MRAGDPVQRASEIQHAAAVPGVSVALRAAAGSGKTSVLINRFVRLCVEGDGQDVHPRSILAVTFTRKAATEIRERLLKRARDLALTDDRGRSDRLAALFTGRDEGAPTARELDRAARLYERLLEDPGGLQVGTIHSFCQRILARFATEAGLDPHASLLEDREDLLDEALDLLLVEAAADPDSAALVAELGGGPGAVRVGVRAVFGEQMRLDRWLRRLARCGDVPALPRTPLLPGVLAELRIFLWPGETLGDDLEPGHLLPSLLRALKDFAGPGLDAVVSSLDVEDLDKVGKYVDGLRSSANEAVDGPIVDPQAAVDAARKVLLTKAGAVRKFAKGGGAVLKTQFQELVTEAAVPVLATLRSLELVGLYRRNRALLTLGLRALDLLDELKQRDRVLDFGDLEDLAVRLMGDESRALSLLFRLEDSISHILVDEYQDTNFNQRDILEPFVDEFLAGGSGEGTAPTVFFVGDMKQAIYGFRGAEPDIFAAMMRRLATRGEVHTLPTNFRSLPAVVDGVGGLFTVEPLVSCLPSGEAGNVHQATARDESDGLLVLLEGYKAEDGDAGRTADQVAADAAARIVRELVDGRTQAWERRQGKTVSRDLQWSDVLVLYRSRRGVSLYEQAFRAAGIPIEPAGRGMLAASREVQDLLTLLRWLVWPDDDVALATVLRSPLFRLPEDLFQRLLAARGLTRPGTSGRWRAPDGLWKTLCARCDDDPRLAGAVGLLKDWRNDLGHIGCHELLRRIYREGDVLDRYEAAGGAQARINLERLHDIALEPEVAGSPTVRRLIDLVDKAGRRGGQDEGTSGRSGERGRVRFMTVHGAKGLEAPVVLLVDADRALRDRNTEIKLNPHDAATGVIFGATKSLRGGFGGALPADLLQGAGEAAARDADREETNLLYVAMTRAQERLYVLGGLSRAKDHEGEAPATPLRRLRAGAAAAPSAPVNADDPAFLERPPEAFVASPTSTAAGDGRIRIWTPPAMGERPAVVTPSSVTAGGVRMTTSSNPEAIAHGLKVHLLLQLAAQDGALPPGSGSAYAEAAAVLADPRLEWLFQPETVQGRGWSEAPVIMRRGGGSNEERVTGVIDRLIVRPDRIDVVDYKTNRWGGDPTRKAWLIEHYRAQLSAYGAAAAALFPGRGVRTWLLLTDPAGRRDDESGLCEII